ncbi:MAG: YbaK/EbsC family protein, partial [Christensenellales bacterium]
MIQDVKRYFSSLGRENEVLEFSQSSATVALAAKALGVSLCRIAKTLSLKKGDSALLLVVAGDARIDNRKFKAHFSSKARMLSPQDAFQQTGHIVGGVCPFALKNPLPIYLDLSLQRF